MQNTLTMTNPKDLASHLATKLAEDKTQDSADFALLVSQHSQVLYRIAMAVARNSHDAEDIVQESFLQLYRTRNWPEINDQRAYLARVAWRLAVRRHNHKSRPIHQELSLDLQRTPPSTISARPRSTQCSTNCRRTSVSLWPSPHSATSNS